MSFTVADEIRELLAAFSKQPLSLDYFIGVDGANVQQDFKTMLAVASLPGLRLLQAAFQANRVINLSYFDHQGGGCLAFHLFGVCNNDQLVDLDLPSVETGFAIYRTIQAWDVGRLGREIAEHYLEQEIIERESHTEVAETETQECLPA